MSKLSFLDPDGDEPAVAPEPQVDAPSDGLARDASGKFVSAAEPEALPEPPVEAPAAEPVAPVAPVAETPPTAPPEPTTAPLTALLDERDKRQTLERELAALKAKQAPPPAPEPAIVPNPAEDPEGYARWTAQQIDDRAYGQTIAISRRFALKELGAETLEKLHDWAFARCAEDPHFNAQVRASDDPYAFAKQHYDQAQILASIQPTELDEFNAWKAAKAAALADPAPAALAPAPPQAPTPPKPPVSLVAAANAGGQGGSPPVGPGHAFSEVFSPR